MADIVSSGANPNYQQFYLAKALDPIKPALILPEVVDQTKWYLKKHQYSDPEGQYVFNYVGSATYGAINYNTKLVDVKEFRSYWDLAQSQMERQDRGRDIREAGSRRGQHAVLLLSCRISDRHLFKQAFRRDGRNSVSRFSPGAGLAGDGKICHLFFLRRRCSEAARFAGGHFRSHAFSKKAAGWFSSLAPWRLVNRAPHPNAAKVFINWLLSRRGQIALQQKPLNGESPADSLRIDIPKEDVPLLESPARRHQISRHRQAGMDRDEADR